LIKLVKQNKYIFICGTVGVVFLIIIFSIALSKSSVQSNPDQPATSNKSTMSNNIPSNSPTVPTFDPIKQEAGEKAFSAEQEAIHNNYPWIDKLPVQTTDYFVYFIVNKKSFVGNLYPADTSKNFIVSQVVTIKAQIRKSLINLNIEFSKYPFVWNIKPENRKIIGDSSVPVDQRPGLIKKESFNNNITKYTYTSSLPDRPNIITTQGSNIIFQRTVTDSGLPIQIKDYTDSYGAPKLAFKGSNNYGAQAQSYIYPDLGFAFIANPQTGVVYEQQIFTPTKAEDYINKYGDDIPVQP
jgi:hypothetical protein